MEAIYKNTRGQEFCALMQTMENLGFSQADVGRLLNKTRGAMSQYLSGYAQPSETVLSLLRKIVEEKTGKDKPPASQAELHEQLDDLARHSPPDFEVARTTIGLLYGKLPLEVRERKTASSASDEAKKLGADIVSDALAAAEQHVPGSPGTSRKNNPKAKAAPLPGARQSVHQTPSS